MCGKQWLWGGRSLLFTDARIGRPKAGKGVFFMSKSNKCDGREYMGFVAGLSDDGLRSLEQAVERAKLIKLLGADDYDGLAKRFGRIPTCPDCGAAADSPCAHRKGSGQEIYRCPECGKYFTIMSGSVLASSKIEPWRLFLIIRMMAHNASADEIADIAGAHHNTVLLVRRKLFETIGEWQSKVRLAGTVFIDEIYTFDSAMPKDHFGKNPRGLNRKKCCVFLAVDSKKDMIAFLIGHGKPTKEELKKALLPHLSEGAEIIVHDGEKAHSEAITESGVKDEVHLSADKSKESLKAMLLINSFCSWVQRYLDGYTGMDSEYLQDYLNWFVYVFRCKSDSKKWPVGIRVLRHMILANKRLRRKDLPERKRESREEMNKMGRVYPDKKLQVTQKSGRFEKGKTTTRRE